MIWVVSGEYTTQPVRTGISEAPRCLPARLTSTPTNPASTRVTRRKNMPKSTKTKRAPMTSAPILKNGPACFISNVDSFRPPPLNITTSFAEELR